MGLVITCDANRNAHAALFHVDETSEQEATPLGLLQTMNKAIRNQTGVDHNIGIKTPVLMHKAGLKNIGARMSDCVRLLFPPMDSDSKEALFRAVCDEGYGRPKPTHEERLQWKGDMLKRGISEEEAQKEIDRERARDFRTNGREYHSVCAGLLNFSFGTVEKTQAPQTGHARRFSGIYLNRNKPTNSVISSKARNLLLMLR